MAQRKIDRQLASIRNSCLKKLIEDSGASFASVGKKTGLSSSYIGFLYKNVRTINDRSFLKVLTKGFGKTKEEAMKILENILKKESLFSVKKLIPNDFYSILIPGVYAFELVTDYPSYIQVRMKLNHDSNSKPTTVIRIRIDLKAYEFLDEDNYHSLHSRISEKELYFTLEDVVESLVVFIENKLDKRLEIFKARVNQDTFQVTDVHKYADSPPYLEDLEAIDKTDVKSTYSNFKVLLSDVFCTDRNLWKKRIRKLLTKQEY